MDIKIGAYAPSTGTVPVKFSHNGFIHRRPVNAVMTADGRYDKTATRERAHEVARGVIAKIERKALAPRL